MPVIGSVSGGAKVNRAISGATTVNANCYAEVDYESGGNSIAGTTQGSDTPNTPQGEITTRTFGPAQSIPATFTTIVWHYQSGGAGVPNVPVSITWTLLSGVEWITS